MKKLYLNGSFPSPKSESEDGATPKISLFKSLSQAQSTSHHHLQSKIPRRQGCSIGNKETWNGFGWGFDWDSLGFGLGSCSSSPEFKALIRFVIRAEGCGWSITTEDKTASVIGIVAHRDSVHRSYIQEDYRAVYSEDLLKRL